MFKHQLILFFRARPYLGEPVKAGLRALGGLRRRRQIETYMTSRDVHKLQLGAGSNALEGWLNTDYLVTSRATVFLDATQRFPLDDGSFDYVFSEHQLEHLPFPGGMNMLRECFRVLKPGGKLRLVVPSLDAMLALCRDDKSPQQMAYIQHAVDDWLPKLNLYNECMAFNHLFNLYGHQFIYDRTTLTTLLKRVGFEHIVDVQPLQSTDPVLRNLECRTDAYSLYESMALEASHP